MVSADLHLRIAAGARYLHLMNSADLRDGSWEGLYERHKGGELTIEESMVLINPRFYEDSSLAHTVRGPRRFVSEAGLAGVSCQSKLIWGYACSLHGQLAADHLWPFSLGGPTIATNKLYLCGRHNSIKTGDIHLYPWEQGMPMWLEFTLSIIARCRSAQR